MKARDLLKQSTRLSIGVAGKIRSPSGTAQATSASEQINQENQVRLVGRNNAEPAQGNGASGFALSVEFSPPDPWANGHSKF